MNTSVNSKPRANDDEIDLIPLLQALWAHKKTIIAATIVGAVISLSVYMLSPEQWTASTYISKPSLLSLYKEVKEHDTPSTTNPLSPEAKLYSTIQNDVFYTALGIMTANAITVKETPPRSGNNEPVLYIASATATTAAQAIAQLKTAMDTANVQAITLNLPNVAPDKTLRAFNALDEVKTGTIKKTKKFAYLGAALGFILASAFVLGRFLLQQHKQFNRT
ncbi:hypothetical protein PspS35_08430 [Pseudomonas sp. S35]|uniref:Wzz/FepE/Etk N-terminal domain-containing protein n=1 Tax=Pseudomonas sp. S35 TaxID=1573719 RepID=UPI00132F30F3|nr:Wzz/FepE/Etk N-terminal domain-containing protein [Pseudomonas sp. S35]QHF43827.1 hypothetical protein PspS35_08430 [Pseudomonas sp. S35]